MTDTVTVIEPIGETPFETSTEASSSSSHSSSEQPQLLDLTSEIVSSYVSNHSVELSEVKTVIDTVYNALAPYANSASFGGVRPRPAVPVDASVFDDYIVCLEDGKKLKMLKRHLKSSYNMTPEQYRERWGLPADYPMVAPNYARRRSDLALKIGLGTRRKGQSKAA